MRLILAAAAVLSLALVAPASGAVRIVGAHAAGPVVAGQPVDIVVETDVPVDAGRLTFPDLHGTFATTLCSLSGGPGTRRFVLPYRPAWVGVHSLHLSVTAGACGLRPRSDWRLLRLEAAPAAPRAAAASGACADGGAPPIPRAMRGARLAVVCLLNAERTARGLPPLAPSERLRRIASRAAHAPRRPRRGEQRTVTPGLSPSAVVTAWLASEAHREDLLDPAVREIGVAVRVRFPEPLRRPEAAYVVELD